MPFPVYVAPSSFTFDRRPNWGEVYWFDFGHPRSNQATIGDPHLGVIISDGANRIPGTVLLLPITGAENRKPGYRFHVPVTKRECPKLDKDSVVKVDHIYCVNVRKDLPDQYYLTAFGGEIMHRIFGELVHVLGFGKLKPPTAH